MVSSLSLERWCMYFSYKYNGKFRQESCLHGRVSARDLASAGDGLMNQVHKSMRKALRVTHSFLYFKQHFRQSLLWAIALRICMFHCFSSFTLKCFNSVRILFKFNYFLLTSTSCVKFRIINRMGINFTLRRVCELVQRVGT